VDLKKISDSLERLVQLEVKTIVGDYSEQEGRLIPSASARVISSRINLLNGDITTAMHEDFLMSPLDDIRQYHAEREQQSQQLIHNNIQALKELTLFAAQLTRQQHEQVQFLKNNPDESGLY
jgi:hypothetical protein